MMAPLAVTAGVALAVAANLIAPEVRKISLEGTPQSAAAGNDPDMLTGCGSSFAPARKQADPAVEFWQCPSS
jgi:hypothetical protein